MLEKIMESEKADHIAGLKSKRSKCSMSRKFWDWQIPEKRKIKEKKKAILEQAEFDF